MAISLPMDDENSDWEYEYHETDTEDFYVTLDLSSYSKVLGQGIEQQEEATANGNPVTPAPTTTSHTQENAEEGDENSPRYQPEPPILPSSTETHLRNQIQIVDLHTRNPLVSYNSQLYSCDWTSTIGTDMLFTATHPQPSIQPTLSSRHPRYPPQTASPSLPSASLLVTTRIKLSARPVRAFPRSDNVSFSASNAEIAGEGLPAYTDPKPSTVPPLIPVAPGANPNRQNQAAFLTRLINIKQAKGENDEVTVYARQGGIRGGEAEDFDDDFDEEVEEVPNASPDSVPTRRARGSSRRSGRGRGRASGWTRRTRRVLNGATSISDRPPAALDGEVATAQRTPDRWEDHGANESAIGSGNQELEASGEQGPSDWTQRLAEHLQGGRSVVVVAEDVVGNEGDGLLGNGQAVGEGEEYVDM